MADYDSSLPIRTEAAGDAIVKICDPTITTQQLAVDANGFIGAVIKDASGTGITSQVNGSQRALDVGVNVAGVQVDPRAIRALTSADVVKARIQDGGGVDLTSQVNGSQRALDVGVNVAGVQVDPRSIRALTSSDVVTANIKDSSGVAFSNSNPLPVSVVTGGTQINDYDTSSALAAAGTHNHDYTVTVGKTLYLTQIDASGSGKIKIEVQVDLGAGFVTKFVQFNSAATPGCQIPLSEPIAVAATKKVRVITTNRDNQSQDVYSTICGHEI